MEAVLGIPRRGGGKRRRRGAARQAPSLRTEWVGWRHSASLYRTSCEHEWDPSYPPSTGDRTLKLRKESPELTAPSTKHPVNSPHATQLLWLSKEILRPARSWRHRISAEEVRGTGHGDLARSGQLRAVHLEIRRYAKCSQSCCPGKTLEGDLISALLSAEPLRSFCFATSHPPVPRKRFR